MRAGPDHLVRVRVEGERHHRQLPGLGDLAGPLHDALVASVHAVELADRRDARTPVGRHLGQAVPAVHDPRSSFALCRQREPARASLEPQAKTTSGLACPDSSVTRAIRVPSGAKAAVGGPSAGPGASTASPTPAPAAAAPAAWPAGTR